MSPKYLCVDRVFASVEPLGAISVIRFLVFFAQATWRIPKSLLTSGARNMAKNNINNL